MDPFGWSANRLLTPLADVAEPAGQCGAALCWTPRRVRPVRRRHRRQYRCSPQSSSSSAARSPADARVFAEGDAKFGEADEDRPLATLLRVPVPTAVHMPQVITN